MHITNAQLICTMQVHDKATGKDTPCDRQVYAKGQCRRCYNRVRWDYEEESRRHRYKRAPNAKPRAPQIRHHSERVRLMNVIAKVRENPVGLKCYVVEADGLPVCGRPRYGRLGCCMKHKERERLLRKQVDMPRPDKRVKNTNANRTSPLVRTGGPIKTDELELRREAARRGISPGAVAMERGVAW